jgi:hypothetical protein
MSMQGIENALDTHPAVLERGVNPYPRWGARGLRGPQKERRPRAEG